jgi:hypothetical protein
MLKVIFYSIIALTSSLKLCGQSSFEDSAVAILNKRGVFQKIKSDYLNYATTYCKKLDSLSKKRIAKANLRITSSVNSGKYLAFGFFINGNLCMGANDREEAFQAYTNTI